jgi:predicted DNA binding CopG/RHH family protein
MNIQYLGFEQDLKSRTYAFRVIETLKPDRQFQLSVDTQLLTANKFKLQDIPDLCFAKLKRDLASETAEQTAPLRMRVSEIELQQYLANHYQSKPKRS